MSDSVRPHPWDSPGKNTGVGCHFLLQCKKVKSESEVARSCPTLRNPMDCSLPGSSVHGIFQARVLEWVPLPSLINNINVSKYCLISQVALVVKNPPARTGDIRDACWSAGLGRSPGAGHGNRSSICAWRISWTEEPDWLQSKGMHRVRHD